MDDITKWAEGNRFVWRIIGVVLAGKVLSSIFVAPLLNGGYSPVVAAILFAACFLSVAPLPYLPLWLRSIVPWKDSGWRDWSTAKPMIATLVFVVAIAPAVPFELILFIALGTGAYILHHQT